MGSQIIDHFFLPEATSRPLKDEVMKIMPVQKQTRAGQRTRFKAFVAIGDSDGHCGLGVKCAKEVASAIRGAIIAAKLSLIPVRFVCFPDNPGKKKFRILQKVFLSVGIFSEVRRAGLFSGEGIGGTRLESLTRCL